MSVLKGGTGLRRFEGSCTGFMRVGACQERREPSEIGRVRTGFSFQAPGFSDRRLKGEERKMFPLKAEIEDWENRMGPNGLVR